MIETDKLDNTTTRKRIRFRYESTAVVAAVTVVVQYFSLPSHLPTAPLPPFVALHAARHFRFHRDRHGRVHRRNSELLTAKRDNLNYIVVNAERCTGEVMKTGRLNTEIGKNANTMFLLFLMFLVERSAIIC